LTGSPEAMKQLANQLLPLWVRLATLDSEDQMRSLFLETVNSALEGVTVGFTPDGGLQPAGTGIELSSETSAELRDAAVVFGLLIERHRLSRTLQTEQRRNEARSRLFEAHVPVGLAEMNAAGECTYVNQQLCEITGVPAERILGSSWVESVHPEDRTTVVQQFQRCVDAGSHLDERFRCLRPDGSVRHVWAVVTVEHDGDGSVSGFAGAVADVTPAREAEAALQRNEERLRLTLDAVEEAVLEYNRETGETYFSPRFYRMLGYQPGQFPASRGTFWALLHPDEAESGLARLRASYVGPGPFCVDYRLRGRAGEWRWMRFRGRVLTRDAAGDAVRILATMLDVTEQREAEEELRLILRMCFDGFVVISHDLRILNANEAYCRLTGYSREELLNLSLPELDVIELPDAIRGHMAQIRADGWQRFETGHRRKDGNVVPLEVNLSWSPSGGGRYIGFVRDLTARNTMLQKLRESESQYRALVDNQAGVVFTASVDGVVQYASPQTEQIFGCSPSLWVGKRLIDMAEAGYKETVRQQWTRVLAGEAVEPVEVEFRCHLSGVRRWTAIALSLQPGTGRTEASLLGTIWDLTERKEVEESLQRSEEQLRSVWEASTDGIRLTDGAGTVLRVNDSFCRMFGRTREETEGRPLEVCYGPAEGERILRNYRGRYPAGFAPLFEAQVELWNGTRKWLEVSNSIIPRSGGPLVLSIFRDITERKATERQLSVLVRGIEQSPASVVVTDTEGRIEFVNPKFCEITGYSAEEVYGQNPRILKSGANPEFIYSDLWATISQGRKWQGEMINRRRDGSLFWEQASISPVKNARGEVTHYVAVKEDITERKRVQQALEESERRFREMLERVELLAVLLDLDGRITFCNDYLCRVTGWTREELMGQDWFEMMIPADIRAALRHGHTPHMENEILARDGRRLLISWDNTTLRGPSGEISGTASLGRDITSQRMLEEQYRQAQKLESLGRLAGGVAHDFNNLLTVINGYSEMMMEEFHPLDQMHLKTREILRAGLRAADLTRQLLAFSRKQVIERQVVQLNGLLLEMKRMLQRLIGEDIRLELHTHADLGCVDADPSQIHQVLMNLAVNARDAMPKGGILRIETEPLEILDGVMTEWDLPAGRYAQFIVTDTGMGMDAETQKHAFEPFFTTKGVDKGTGLGLATVYGIVKQNGGGIQFESRLGEGTSFRVAFPVCAKAPATAAVAAANPAHGTESVLLVEDQAEVRRLAATILRMSGYQVSEAADGLEGLRLANERQFDLLLSDIVMPNLNGYELAHELRKTQPAIRVLLMSGHADQDEGDSPASLGAKFISKPFSPNNLTARVREVLDS
jgi:two-component system, cell cycle sensor histidine kinase and response regulator CckA